MDKNRDLKGKTIRGFKWSFIDQFGKAGGQFLIGIILARILTPADFGLIGMITIFIVIGQSLTNSGFGQALIQNKNATSTDFSTVFYFNIAASFVIYSIIFLAAPLIADFYNEPDLIPLTRAICLSFIFDAFSLIHKVYLDKKLDFKAPSIVGVSSVTVAGAVSIYLAYIGYGVWALVANTIIRSIVGTILLWWVSPWSPLMVFSLHSLRTLFGYGSKILIAGIVRAIFENIYFLIIGRLFSAQQLGYFTRAWQFKDLPLRTVTMVVQKVTFPVFSTIQDEEEQLISGFTRTIRLLLMASLALMIMIFITARPMILLVLGEKWLPVVPYLRLMSLYSWIYVVFVINNQIVTVKGRSDYFLHIQIIDKILILISIFVTYRYGITAMILGHMAATITSFLVSSYYMRKVINISLIHQIKNMIPFMAAAGLMLLSSLPLDALLDNEYIYLFSSVITGTIIYLAALWLMHVKELKAGMEIVRNGVSRFSLFINKK